MVSLTLAFLYAGSPAIVASLWKVGHESTAMLMTAFYGHLKRGLGPAAALRSAQADTRTPARAIRTPSAGRRSC